MLALPGLAQAFTCPQTPLEQRIQEADGVFVGRSTGFRPVENAGGIAQRTYFFAVDQRVKGQIGSTVEVRIPALPEHGGQKIPNDVAAGILMTRTGGRWVTSRCGITDPGAVLAVVDEPRGNAIKILIGGVILLTVLLYSRRRLKHRDRSGYARYLRP